MRKLIQILFIVIFFSCSNDKVNTQNEELEEYLTVLDSLTIDEVKVTFTKQITAAKKFLEFFDSFSSNEIKFFEEETYEAAFNIDTTNVAIALSQFNAIEFEQDYENDITNLEFNFRNDSYTSLVNLGEGVTEEFIPKKIFYKNGEVLTENINNNNVSFHFSYDWGKIAIIDSIEIAYEINYINDFKTISITPENPIINYKGGIIELIKLEKNYAYFKISDTIPSFIKTQAYNNEGKALYKTSSSSSRGFPIEEREEKIERALKYGENIEKKLNNNKFKTIEELKNYLRADLADLDFFKSDGFRYKEMYYKGNVAEIKIYFENKSTTKSSKFIAVNSIKSQDVIEVALENGTLFLDSKGKELFKTTNKNLTHLTSNYYEDNDYYYHLKDSLKSLDTLLVYNIISLKNGIVAIQQNNDEDNFALFDSRNKQITTYKYWEINELYSQQFGRTEKEYFKIDSLGNETLLPNVSQINDAEGKMIALKNKEGKYGFMNSNGTNISPIIYKDYDEFSEGLAFVSKDGDNYGCIDKTGKVVLPFKFKLTEKFIDGITTVKSDKKYKIINKKGEVLLYSDTPIYIPSSGARTYKLDNGEVYNSKAQLIKKE